VIERTFDLASNKNSSEEGRKIHHFQFLKWPNYGVPDAAGPISDFVKRGNVEIKEFRKKFREINSGVLIHRNM